MLTLSSDFTNRSNLTEQNKILVAHLYYSDTNYLALSTVATVIDNVQYYGILRNPQGFSQKWNITGNNNVTINSPTLNIADYNTPNDYKIIEEFNNYTYYGRKMIIYVGYENQSITNMAKLFEGKIDDVNFKNNEIVIKGKSFEFPEVTINGRKIDYENNALGDNILPDKSGSIIKENDGKYLPIPFGNNWNVPATAYATSGSGDVRYCPIDSDYSDMLYSAASVLYNVKQTNIGRTDNIILIDNDDFYTPLYQRAWSVNQETYTANVPTGKIPYTIQLLGTSYSSHSRSDEQIHVQVPLQPLILNPGNAISSSFVSYGGEPIPTGDWSDDRVREVFGTDLNSSPISMRVYYPQNEDCACVTIYVNTKLDLDRNLRGDEDGIVRPGRLIHVPSTPAFDNGSGLLMGSWIRETVVPEISNYFNRFITVYSWIDGFLPTASLDAYNFRDREDFIGASVAGTEENKKIDDEYNFCTRVYGSNLSSAQSDIHMANFNTEADDLAYYGKYAIKSGSMGNNPSIDRDALGKNVTCRYQITCSHEVQEAWKDNEIWKLFHLSAGNVDVPYDVPLYCGINGLVLTDSNDLLSTPKDETYYQMNRPYEYIEFLIRANVSGTVDVDFGSSFNNISNKWYNFFDTFRDDSGFVIEGEKETTLKSFIDEYVKHEPFTVFRDESGEYHIPMLQKTYTTNDIDGTLDFNDQINFEMTKTPSKNVYSEVRVKTDYQYAFENYVNNVNYAITAFEYDYSHWHITNTYDNNQFKAKDIEKKYTSYTDCSRVSHGGYYWGAVKNNLNQEPSDTNTDNWIELTSDSYSGLTAWLDYVPYYGADNEGYEIASWYLNQWANRHNIVKFTTDKLPYMKYTVGDIVNFENVPYQLLGMDILGFNGNNNFETTLNGQTIYGAFIVTAVNKSLDKIQLECLQLHDLTAYTIIRKTT